MITETSKVGVQLKLGYLAKLNPWKSGKYDITCFPVYALEYEIVNIIMEYLTRYLSIAYFYLDLSLI